MYVFTENTSVMYLICSQAEAEGKMDYIYDPFVVIFVLFDRYGY